MTVFQSPVPDKKPFFIGLLLCWCHVDSFLMIDIGKFLGKTQVAITNHLRQQEESY